MGLIIASQAGKLSLSGTKPKPRTKTERRRAHTRHTRRTTIARRRRSPAARKGNTAHCRLTCSPTRAGRG